MKTVIKLLIVAAVVNATVRVAAASWRHYQFEDATQQVLLFGRNATELQLHDLIAQRAVDLEIPIDPADIEVVREPARTLARASYTQPVELFPRYFYPMAFSFEVDTLAVNPATVNRVLPGAK
jgi:hypothetical protein